MRPLTRVMDRNSTERAHTVLPGQITKPTHHVQPGRFDNFGENVVACPADGGADGKIYYWENVTSTIAAPLTNAPISNQGVLVTDERFVMAFGAGGNARKVQWSDQENPTVWAPVVANAAGSFELASEGKIRAGGCSQRPNSNLD